MERQGGSAVHRREPKRKHLTGSECQALTESREGSSPLTRPFSQRQTSRDLNWGLYPRHRTQRSRRGQSYQRSITDYFRIKGDSSQCQVNSGDQKAQTKEVNDFAVAAVGPFSPLGPSITGRERKLPCLSQDIGSQNGSPCNWSGSIAAPVSQTYSRSRIFIEHTYANSNKQCFSNQEQNNSIEEENMHLCTEDELFYRALDDFSESSMEATSRSTTRPLAAKFSHPFHKQMEINDDPDFEFIPDACFGLLGTSVANTGNRKRLIQFSDEVLLTIFGFLPVTDLYQNISLVCQHWRSLVDDPLFIPWKKFYHKYVKQEEKTVEKVNGILLQYRICDYEEMCVLNFIRCVATIRCLRRMNPEAILASLKCHHLYTKAEACVTRMLPDIPKTSGTVNVWAIMAAIVLLSDGVPDVRRLMSCLNRPNSTLSQVDITEALYRMATLLYAMREKKINISNRIHYSIIYCLIQLENSSPARGTFENTTVNTGKDASLRNRSDIRLTREQEMILNHEIVPGEVVKIMAFAGTGKTSTLIKYAERRPHLRFLYAAFNKAISKQAAKQFPKNVECRTFHSIAYSQVGHVYAKMHKLNFFKLTAYTINRVLPEGRAGFIRAKMVAQTIEAFFASADDVISTEHVPIWRKNTHGEKVLVERGEKVFVAKQAEKIWNKMRSTSEETLDAYKMTHDGYLKEWQLRKPYLGQYNAIFVDEAQDCTPAIMNVVLSQPCGAILVGDPHQQIYTFRGAVNALFEVQHSHIFYLTQSFRFGAEIAYVGATILDVSKNLRNKTLVGGNQGGTVNGVSEGQVAILSRTNSCVFTEAVRATEGSTPAKIHLIGGPENFGLNRILDIWRLLQPAEELKKQNHVIRDPFIRKWSEKVNGFSSLKKYATEADDKELEAKISIVEKFNIRIPELVNRLRNAHVADPMFADYILSTVHKAKGMEFETVRITDDFVKIIVPQHSLDTIRCIVDSFSDDEWNLLYVAVTRAKKHLILTRSVEHILSLAGEYFLRAELTTDVLKDGVVLCWSPGCSNAVQPDSILTMKKLPMTYSDLTENNGGYLCPVCVERRLGSFAYLTTTPYLVHSEDINDEELNLPDQLLLIF